MLIVPLRPLPNQSLQAQLGSQPCGINVYQTDRGLFMDLLLNGDPVISGVLCENLNRIVRSLYLGFSGDFVFVDTQGSDDPNYVGLGNRYVLVYLAPAELPAGEG